MRVCSDSLPEELVALMKELWEKVVHEATARIDTIKNDMQNEVLQLKKTLITYNKKMFVYNSNIVKTNRIKMACCKKKLP